MMNAAEAASVVGGRTSGTDARFYGVSTDSRSIGRGELFVALRGERFDGHEYLGAAAARGAAAAMVDRDYQGPYPLPLVIVHDTKRALGDLARAWRSRFAPVLIAITGSNGKTTVKEMLAAILRRHGGDQAVLATSGNFNNDIGVPLTLLKMRPAHRWCAIELGMNHRGEIADLAGMAAPSIALVNNAQREHLEFMGSVDEVAAENASVYDALPDSGTAVINADDEHAAFFRSRAGARRRVEFGLKGAPVGGRYALGGLQSELRLRTPQGEAQATLAISGLHNVRNALAAAACGHAAGIEPAAIDVLAACAAPTVLVLGDMGEVGPQGPALHREIGAYARAKGITRLLALGDAASHAVEAFGAAGAHFSDVNELVAAVQGRTVLVKGSRFMKMERVVAALLGTP